MNTIKILTLSAVCACALVGRSSTTQTDKGTPHPVTTNLVLYADIHKPKGTYNLHGTRINLSIRDGLITECRSDGVFDLFSGLPEAEAFKEIEESRKKREARRPLFAGGLKREREDRARAQAVSNRTEGAVSPLK